MPFVLLFAMTESIMIHINLHPKPKVYLHLLWLKDLYKMFMCTYRRAEENSSQQCNINFVASRFWKSLDTSKLTKFLLHFKCIVPTKTPIATIKPQKNNWQSIPSMSLISNPPTHLSSEPRPFSLSQYSKQSLSS